MTDGWRDRLQKAIDDDPKGRSLRDISLEAGLSPGYLHGCLRYGKEPTIERFLEVCRVLNVSAAYILGGASISSETEQIIRLLEGHPEQRAAILALLPRE